MRVHSRDDLQYIVVKGRPIFSRAAYACVITQSTAYPDERAIYHVETFYGADGRKIRAEAMRYGRAIVSGKRGVCGYRSQYLPCQFPKAGIPKRESEIEVRGLQNVG
jgi:hypothetical protein